MEVAVFVVVTVLVHIGLKKWVLVPLTSILYLGMLVESVAQAFSVPKEKREKFAQLREGILVQKSSVPLKSIRNFMGKCISFLLAFPGAKLYIGEMAASIACPYYLLCGKKSHFGISWKIGAVLFLGNRSSMLCSPFLQMLHFIVRQLLSI